MNVDSVACRTRAYVIFFLYMKPKLSTFLIGRVVTEIQRARECVCECVIEPSENLETQLSGHTAQRPPKHKLTKSNSCHQFFTVTKP